MYFLTEDARGCFAPLTVSNTLKKLKQLPFGNLLNRTDMLVVLVGIMWIPLDLVIFFSNVLACFGICCRGAKGIAATETPT